MFKRKEYFIRAKETVLSAKDYVVLKSAVFSVKEGI